MKDEVYFDNAATSWPKPETVYRHMDHFSRTLAVNPGRSGHALGVAAAQEVQSTRMMLAEFFNFAASASRVVFALNITDAMNIAVRGLLSPGDHLIGTRIDHNAALRLCNHLEREQEVSITRVSANAEGRVNAADIEAALRTNTRAVMVNHASNVHGAVQEIAAISAITRRHGALLIVDAAQTAGVLPLDMQALGIDILCFTGHKGLFAPMGVGGLLINEGIELKPLRVGGTGVNSADPLQPQELPEHLEAGTLPLPAIAGVNAAQRWFRALGMALDQGQTMTAQQAKMLDAVPWQRLGAGEHKRLCDLALREIHQHELSLLDRIADRLRADRRITLYAAPPSAERVATLSFTVEGLSAERIATMLDADHGVAVRAGLHCAPLVHADAGTLEQGGAVRLAPGYFTDEDDMDQLFAALDDVLSLS